MHTYSVGQVAGLWLLKSTSGESMFCADDRESAILLVQTLSRSGEALVTFLDKEKGTRTLYSCVDGIERAETLLLL